MAAFRSFTIYGRDVAFDLATILGLVFFQGVNVAFQFERRRPGNRGLPARAPVSER